MIANVISGNGNNGVMVYSEGIIQGNLIGTDATGTAPLGNSGSGVYLEGCNTTIGGTTPEARNVISANGQNGIRLCLKTVV